jgi:HSP20 family protein
MPLATGPLSQLSLDLSEQLRRQLRRMLARLDELRALAYNPNTWTPPVDVLELEDAILVRIEAPGVSSEQLRVALLDNLLKIEGRKERPNTTGRLLPEEERPMRFICLERTFGSFAVSIPLKWPINAAEVSAKLADGVLQIRLPKTSACGREISVPISE